MYGQGLARAALCVLDLRMGGYILCNGPKSSPTHVHIRGWVVSRWRGVSNGMAYASWTARYVEALHFLHIRAKNLLQASLWFRSGSYPQKDRLTKIRLDAIEAVLAIPYAEMERYESEHTGSVLCPAVSAGTRLFGEREVLLCCSSKITRVLCATFSVTEVCFVG